MKFRTEYIVGSSAHLDPAAPALLIGSCFSDNIGARMRLGGWNVSVNPCGVLYNPESIANVIRLALMSDLEREKILCDSVVERDGCYVSLFFSSAISGDTPGECIQACGDSLDVVARFLRGGEVFIVTFGTAWVFDYLGDSPGFVVGNCHKLPSSVFSRRRLAVREIISLWRPLVERLHALNPRLRIVFTVSPVRHLKDGLAGNMLSKSILRVAVEELSDVSEYFPAFEIMMDDLRDYRFYSSDMLHPSETAVDYLWEKFCDSFLSPLEKERLRLREKESRRLNHRPLF